MTALDADLQLRLQDLMARYAMALDDGRFEDWPAFFTEDAVYKIVSSENHAQGLPLGVIDCRGRGMLHDRVMALCEANIYEPHRYRHVLMPPVVTGRDGDTVSVETGYHLARIMREGETMLFSTGKYLDRVTAMPDGTLKFAERLVVFDSKRIDTLLVFPI
tara:strand:+ start:472 stop:954 length:483 start_codon:yes stop_codon:yes gene_type:complete